MQRRTLESMIHLPLHYAARELRHYTPLEEFFIDQGKSVQTFSDALAAVRGHL